MTFEFNPYIDAVGRKNIVFLIKTYNSINVLYDSSRIKQIYIKIQLIDNWSLSISQYINKTTIPFYDFSSKTI